MRFVVYSRKRPLRRRQWYWKAVAQNGEQVADGSEGYVNYSDCMASLNRLREKAADAPVTVVEP